MSVQDRFRRTIRSWVWQLYVPTRYMRTSHLEKQRHFIWYVQRIKSKNVLKLSLIDIMAIVNSIMFCLLYFLFRRWRMFVFQLRYLSAFWLVYFIWRLVMMPVKPSTMLASSFSVLCFWCLLLWCLQYYLVSWFDAMVSTVLSCNLFWCYDACSTLYWLVWTLRSNTQ